jgi:hypothetical protein
MERPLLLAAAPAGSVLRLRLFVPPTFATSIAPSVWRTKTWAYCPRRSSALLSLPKLVDCFHRGGRIRAPTPSACGLPLSLLLHPPRPLVPIPAPFRSSTLPAPARHFPGSDSVRARQPPRIIDTAATRQSGGRSPSLPALTSRWQIPPVSAMFYTWPRPQALSHRRAEGKRLGRFARRKRRAADREIRLIGPD